MPSDTISFYMHAGVARFPDTYTWLLGYYARDDAYYVLAEMVYYDICGELPEWGRFIERVDIVEGNTIFIHRDKEVVQ